MAFNEQKFLSEMYCHGFDPRARTTAAEFKALHAEIAELKARLAEPEPPRETGWAVVHWGYVYVKFSGFVRAGVALRDEAPVLWLGEEAVAAGLAVALSDEDINCRPALLYKDTLEEVNA